MKASFVSTSRQSFHSSKRVSALLAVVVALGVLTGFTLVRGRAAFHWSASLTKNFASSSERTLSPPAPVLTSGLTAATSTATPTQLSSNVGDVAVDVANTTIKKLNAADGTVAWSVAQANDGALAVDQGDFGVYTGNGHHGSGSANAYKYDASGGLAWTNPVTGAGCNFYYVNGAAVDTTSGSPGVVFTETSCLGGFAKSNRSTGVQQWSLATNDVNRPSIDPANGQIYDITLAACCNYKTIYSVATTGGAPTSAPSCEGNTDLNPADGMLYRGGNMGSFGCGLQLSQMNKITLAPNWTMTVPGITSFDTLAVQPWSGGYIYVGSANDSRIVLVNPATQTVVGGFSTAVPPNAIAVNPNGGTLYVASSAGNFVYAYSPSGTLLWTSPDLGGPVYNLAAPRGIVGTAPNECDYCVLQFPPSVSVSGGGTTAQIFGRIFESGITPPAGSDPSITAQVGFGPLGSDPRSVGGWSYFPTTFNVQVGNDDEYVGTMTAPVVGTTTQFSYTYRFSLDGGVNWSYADTDGAGTNPGLSFSASQLGTMTVTSPGSLQFFDGATSNDNETNADHTVTVNISRVGGSSGIVGVHYQTSNGTATTADNDYVAASGDLSWGDGDVADKSFTITVKGDTKHEATETVNVTLSAPTGGATIPAPNHILNIINDDAAPTFTINNVTQAETNAGTTNFIFTVTKVGTTAFNATVNYDSLNGTASGGICGGGVDYSTQSGSVPIAAADTTGQITMSVCGDMAYEANETFTVRLTSNVINGNTVITNTPGTGTITNDDNPPATLVVNTTADTNDGVCLTDPGGCTLREAINASNFAGDANTINFNIPVGFISGGVFTIQPTSGLPYITSPVTIDGASQTTFGGDTNVNGPEIVLNGSGAGADVSGLLITGDNSTIKDLVVNGFSSAGLVITYIVDTTPSGNQFLNNYVGTDASGTMAMPNGAGMSLGSSQSSSNTITGNLISGNSVGGISTCDVSNTTFSNNKIGTDRTGLLNVGNGGAGIHFQCSTGRNNTISGNTIAFNSTDGFRDEPDYRFGPTPHFNNRLTQNSIHSNGGLAINLNPPPFGTIDGVTPNDAMDPDTGGNNLQNFPIITSAKVTGTTSKITGTLNTTPNSAAGYTIEFFQNPSCDASGNGEGQTYLGSMTTGTTDASGNVSFTYYVPGGALTVGNVVTATATDANGNTSEFSACVSVIPGTAGEIKFVSASYSVAENAGVVNITVQRNGGSDGAISATFSTSDGTATDADNDYEPVSNFLLSYADGETGSKTVAVTINNDGTYEANETVNLSLSATLVLRPSHINAPLPPAPGDSATLTITNDDNPPATLVVTKTADTNNTCLPDNCSLREAINAANFAGDANVINFNIPAADPGFGSGVFTIQPSSGLPYITTPVTIDGASQTSFGGDTNVNGPEIVLNGSGAGAGESGLLITGDNSTIKDLVVNGFSSAGLVITYIVDTTPSGNQFLNNYVGTDASGTVAVPNGAGMSLGSSQSSSNTITGNLISGNSVGGISTCDVSNTTFSNNKIGTDRTGVLNLGNSGVGIYFQCSTGRNNTITGNTIAFNSTDGFRDVPDYRFGATPHFNNRLTQNSIHSNGGLGINLNPPPFGTIDGVTPNDLLDPDTGGNNLQNFPIITSATVTGSTRTISGSLNTTPSSSTGYTIEFFSNSSCDTLGNGEGKTYLGSVTTGTTDPNGNVSFTFNPASLTAGQVITATATDSSGNTSEFSQCFAVTTGTAGIIEFTSLSYSVAENAGPAAITIKRTGGSDGSIAATFSTSDGTATTGDNDYTPVNNFTVMFADGETADKTVNIPINNDPSFEANETVNLSLSTTTINRPLGLSGSQLAAVLTIFNDDSPAISGRLTYQDSTTGARNVTMTLTGNNGFVTRTTLTDTNGDYTFSDVPTGNDYTVTPSRTAAAHDTSVTAFDASLAAQFAANLISLSTNKRTAGDSSNNGSVTAFDASQIARYQLSIPVAGSIAGAWKFSPASLSFNNLSANQTNQNAAAILVGDVSGNWTPSGPIKLGPSAPDATIPVSLPIKQDAPGGPSIIPITVGQTNVPPGVFSYDFDMFFDPAVLQLQSPAFDTAGTLSSGWGVNANTSTDVNGKVHLILNAFSTTAMTGQGTLINLKFNVVGGGGSTTPLTWAAFNFNEGDPADSDINGTFTAGSPSAAATKVSGQILTGEGQPVAGTTVTVLGGTRTVRAITDSNGFYRVEGLEAGGFYTVTPSRANFVFAPASRSFSLVADKTDAVFTGVAVTAEANPLESPEFFVRQQYLDFLSREPEQSGLDYWSGQLCACDSDRECTSQRRLELSAAFFIAQEFQQSGLFIFALYEGALGRRPDYAEYSVDRRQVVGGPRLEADKAAFAASFVERAAFQQPYPLTMSGEVYVDALLRRAEQSSGLDLSRSRAALITLYNTGTTVTESRSLVLRSVVEGARFKQTQYNAAFVLSEYFGYLGRNPDPDGYEFWLNILNDGDRNNYRGMVCSFVTSTEYQRRFSPVVTRNNAECP